jgi:hypothetical protein
MRGLREALADWTDWDSAEQELACVLGLLGDDRYAPKWGFWSNNPIGEMLSTMLRQLVDGGAPEYRDDPRLTDYQVRWNPAFRGEWEKNRSVPPATDAS